jgi:hypothetical protein
MLLSVLKGKILEALRVAKFNDREPFKVHDYTA